MLILVSAILFAIGIALLALSAALLALRIVLWIVVLVVRTLYHLIAWLLREKSREPVQVEASVSCQVQPVVTYTLTKNKIGIWVLGN
jgi:hypothetical protein